MRDLLGVSLTAGKLCAIEAGAERVLQPVADDILAAARQSASNIDQTRRAREAGRG